MTDKITVTDDAIEIEVEAEAKEPRYCLCGMVRIDYNAEQVSIEDLPKKQREWAERNMYEDGGGWIHVETGCTRETQRLFAPGHDARFKGLLQTAHRMGGSVWFEGVSTEPEHFAQLNTPGLVADIMRPVAPKPERKRKPKAEVRKVRAKVGRWEYDGEIVLVGAGTDRTEHFHYTTDAGENKVSSNFKIVGEVA